MNTYDEWSRVLEKYGKTLGAKSLKKLHIHLSGIDYGSKGEKNHLPLAEADLDLKALFKALNEFGCGGRILCESPIMEEDALIMKKTWMKISGEKDKAPESDPIKDNEKEDKESSTKKDGDLRISIRR